MTAPVAAVEPSAEPTPLDRPTMRARGPSDVLGRRPSTELLGSSRSGCAVGQEPRESLGHRLDECGVLLSRNVISCEESQRGAESRGLGLVSKLTVARLPAHERAGGLGQAEQLLTIFVPAITEIMLLDLGKSGALGMVIRVEPPRLVPVPTPRRTFDPVDVEHAKVVGEPIELGAARTCASFCGHE